MSGWVAVVAFVFVGILGGVLGGMGMGGGTLLIPLLNLLGVEQHLAQSVNLIAFVPMSLVAVAIHAKNKLIDYKKVLLIALPALASSIAASFLAGAVGGKSLKVYFGIFLIVLGIYNLISQIYKIVKNRSKKRREKSERGDGDAHPENPYLDNRSV